MTFGRFCANCGMRLAEEAASCSACGVEQVRTCPGCGNANLATSRFCSYCGLPAAARADRGDRVADSAAPVEGRDAVSQRREVSVIFVDVTDFTTLSVRLDSEDVYTFVDEAMQLLVHVVDEYDGTIDKFTGDGLMAIFGAPVAHEDDAERAVRAAWDMQRIIAPVRQRLRIQHGFDLRLRIGVNTGEVIAGRIGNSVHAEYTVIGETVNIAARLQTAAEPDTVLVSASTHARTAANIRYESMPPLVLKGIPGTVPAYRVAGLQPYIGSKRGLPGLDVPMIGREIPLAALRMAYERALTSGRLSIVCVAGDPGVGKTRLTEEFARTILDPYAMRLIATKCLALTRSRPLSGAADLLRNLLGIEPSDPPEAQAEALRAFLTPFLEQISDDPTPYLSSILGVAEQSPEAVAAIRALDESMLQHQTHAAMRTALLGAARDLPLVIIVDDLQWLDPATRDLLTYFIQSDPPAPILLILVTRQLERVTTLSGLIEAAATAGERFTDIALRPLDQIDARALLRKILPIDTLQAQNLRNKIVTRSQGNPLYLEELVRMLIDRGGLERKGATWHVGSDADALLHDLPSTLRGLILTRADCIPRDLRSVLQKASVLGRAFPVRLLQQIVNDDRTDLGAALEELDRRDFLEDHAFGLERGFTFRHILIQEAIHSTLLRRDRQELHQIVAGVIDRSDFWTGSEKDEALAYHWSESSEPARAIPYLLAVAENSARRHANEAAVEHCRKALAILKQAPNVEQQDRARLLLGRALKVLGRLGEAEQVLDEAVRDLYSRLHEGEATAEKAGLYADTIRELADAEARGGELDRAFAHLEEAYLTLAEWHIELPSLTDSVLERMAWVRFRQGKRDDALVRADALVKALEKSPNADPATLANLYNTLGGVLWQLGKPDAAIPYIRRSLALYHKIGYLFGKAIAHMNLGVLFFAQGKWSDAAANFERSEWLRREIGYMVGRASNLYNLGTLRMSLGDHAGARTDLETSLSIAEQLGEKMEAIHTRIGLAQLAVLENRHDDARRLLDEINAQSDKLDSDHRVQVRALTAVVEADDSLERSVALAEDAFHEAHREQLTENEADCARILGSLHARSGNCAAAEQALRTAVDLARKIGDPYREAQALLELGTVVTRLHVTKDAGCNEGKTMVEEAARVFSRLGAKYDVERAHAALEATP